jgi:hypothetical protein
MTLADEFEAECWSAVQQCASLSPPYRPTVWIGMIERHGAVDAARRLLVSGDVQSGFERLIRGGRQDLTVEHAVLLPRWAALFTDADRDAARWRLRQAGGDADPSVASH